MSRFIPSIPGDPGYRDPAIVESPMLTDDAETDGKISNKKTKQKFDNATEGDASALDADFAKAKLGGIDGPKTGGGSKPEDLGGSLGGKSGGGFDYKKLGGGGNFG